MLSSGAPLTMVREDTVDSSAVRKGGRLSSNPPAVLVCALRMHLQFLTLPIDEPHPCCNSGIRLVHTLGYTLLTDPMVAPRKSVKQHFHVCFLFCNCDAAAFHARSAIAGILPGKLAAGIASVSHLKRTFHRFHGTA